MGTGSEGTNNLVTLPEAQEFAKAKYEESGLGTSNSGCVVVGTAPTLGRPFFLVDDGDPSWWESPDINLEHPNHDASYSIPDDWYVQDESGAPDPGSGLWNNTIKTDVRNLGTHPMRDYAVYIQLFQTGCGVEHGTLTATKETDDAVPEDTVTKPADVLKPGVDEATAMRHQWTWNTEFPMDTHRCIKAEANETATAIDPAWSILANEFEAQRNIDHYVIPPPSPPSPGEEAPGEEPPGEEPPGEEPPGDEAPGEEPPPEETPADIQEEKQHEYGFQNRLKKIERYLILFPENYKEIAKVVDLAFIQKPRGRDSEMRVLEPVKLPTPHIPLVIKAGENVDVLVRARFQKDAKPKRELKIPFEVTADVGTWKGPGRLRTPFVPFPKRTLGAVAGFTVKVVPGRTTVTGVVQEGGELVPNARVYIRTGDNLAGAMAKTDKEGRFFFRNICPDVYRIWAEKGKVASKALQVVALGTKKATEKAATQKAPEKKPVEEHRVKLDLTEKGVVGTPIKVILRQIRILDDKDPAWKGKGEVTFGTLVIPDNDKTRRQASRIPEKGTLSVSDAPGKNDVEIGKVIFDGVVKCGHLSITMSGKEIDLFTKDDPYTRYNRVFTGDPNEWVGKYMPGDEYRDAEDLGDWAVWYEIVPG
jgi:hypothetical protein